MSQKDYTQLAMVAAVLTLALAASACRGAGGPQATLTPSPAAAPRSPTPTAAATSTAVASETLAFIRDGDVWLINADGSNERALGLQGVLSFLWVSRDELDVVARAEPPMHLLVDLDGNVRELLFPGDFDVSGGLSTAHARGSWSADGSLFAVPVNDRLVVYDRDGKQVRQLEVEPTPVLDDPRGSCDESGIKRENAVNVLGSPVFTPDGKSVLVAVFCGAYGTTEGDLGFPRNTYARLYRVSLDAGAVEALLPLSTNLRSDSRPRLSPDGSRVALADSSYDSICSVSFDFSVANAHGSDVPVSPLRDLEELYRQADFTDVGGGVLGGVVGFDWSPQSNAIVTSVDAAICRGFQPQTALTGLYLQKLDGSPGKRLLEGPTHSPAWSPSGRYVAFVSGRWFGEVSEPPLIRLLDFNTGEAVYLTKGSDPAWQPQP
ncbi:MAG: PD40 domain-containing protein [Chloroflexi bacterium]|nr:PD40 domain-containing protein [Chloroflexota bacterium]